MSELIGESEQILREEVRLDLADEDPIATASSLSVPELGVNDIKFVPMHADTVSELDGLSMERHGVPLGILTELDPATAYHLLRDNLAPERLSDNPATSLPSFLLRTTEVVVQSVDVSLNTTGVETTVSRIARFNVQPADLA